MGEVSNFFSLWDQHPPPKQQFSSENESENKYLIMISIQCRAHLPYIDWVGKRESSGL